MKVSEKNPPSEQFVGAILRAYDKAKLSCKQVYCANIWNGVVMECLPVSNGFTRMFEWDKSQVRSGVNRIGTIAETIAGGYVPGLRLEKDAKGRECVVAM